MPQTDVVSWEFSSHSAETAVLKNAVVGLVHWKSRQLAYDDGAYSVDVDQVHGQSHDVSPSVLGRLPLVVVSTGVKVDHVGVLDQVVRQSAAETIDRGSTETDHSHVNTRQQQVVTACALHELSQPANIGMADEHDSESSVVVLRIDK